MIFNNINFLPDEIIKFIFNMISHRQLVFLNKNYYLKYSNILPFYINNYSSYLRDIIRNDYIFVFKNILNNNFKYITSKNKVIFKSFCFNNYLQLIYHYIKYYNANKCFSYLNSNFTSFKKEWLKNNPYKNNRWTS